MEIACRYENPRTRIDTEVTVARTGSTSRAWVEVLLFCVLLVAVVWTLIDLLS